MSDEISKHKQFLEAFIQTRDVKAAARLAGIENPATISSYYSRYKNIYKALFEKLNMPEDTLLENLRDIAADNTAGGHVRLKAIEMILKLMGALTDGAVVVNVNTEDKKRENAVEFGIYQKIKSDAALNSKLMEIIESESMKRVG